MSLFHLLVSWGLVALVSGYSSTCELYIAPSRIPGAGRGIFAGKDFRTDDMLEVDASLTVLYNHTSRMSLAHYVYSCNDEDFSMINFGIGCLLNFVPSKVSVMHLWADDVVNSGASGPLPYTNTTQVYFQTTDSVSAGDELYVSYGESWFEEREGFDEVDTDPKHINTSYPLQDLEEKGVCLSDVVVATSAIAIANHGLHAFRPFRKGELITVTPVLVLPMDIVRDTRDSSVLMNYVWTEPDARVGLFPLSHAAMINHAPTRVGDDSPLEPVDPYDNDEAIQYYANVEVGWFDWAAFVADRNETLRLSREHQLRPAKLEATYEAIVDTPYAPLDLAFFATRDIHVGEELFVDYGRSWETQFQNWLYDSSSEAVIFRHPIHLPPGFLPAHWRGSGGAVEDSPAASFTSTDEHSEL